MCRKVYVILLSHVFVAGFVTVLPAAPQGLELLVEQAGPAPLPCQALRVRLTLRNAGQQNISDLLVPDYLCWLTEMKMPTDSAFQPIGSRKDDGDWLELRRHLGYGATAYAQIKQKKRIALKPGEQLSISGTVQGSTTRSSYALFTMPGDYLLQWGCYYQPDDRAFTAKAKPFAVAVRKPENEDAKAANLFLDLPPLIKDFSYALIYHDGSGLRPETVRALEIIMNRYPKSSYADYARFVLSDYYLYRNKKQDTQEIPEADVAAAIKLLEAIDATKFAYSPDTLIRLRNLYRDKDPDKAKKLEAQLRTHYWDAIEWLEEQATDRVSFEKIMEGRQGPPKGKPAP